MSISVDPITLEVLTQGLISVVREMRATVMRTAKSVAIYEAKDFSCGLFAPDSQVVAQSEDIGSHVVPMPWTVQSAMAKLGDGLEPGDVILVNDPYVGGTHLNDVTIISPVFLDDRLIFFPAVREHWPDVGGMVPGSMSGNATEIYQEGIRIPPIKIMERGKMNDAALEILMANMRVPEERIGDFEAGIAACHVAETRIRELCGRYGVEQLLEAVRIDLDRAETRMRSCISDLPDGTYCYEDYLETYPQGEFEPLLLPLALTISGDRIKADFTGASRQVPVPVNSTLAVSAASVFIAVKSIFDPDAPLNQGSFRPIDVIAPEGTIVNVTRPAPAGSHGEIRKRVIATMVGALSQVAPDKVAGDLCRSSFHNLLGGFDTRSGREWVHYEWSGGGNGGFAEADGPSAMAPFDWGDLVTVQPSEVIESRFPLLVEYSELDTDSGGAGRSRGGLAMRRRIRLTAPDARYSLLSDGAIVPAFGILGGQSGKPLSSWIETMDDETEDFATPGKVGGHLVEEGERVVLRSAGGGGYGDPLDRSPETVAEDFQLGYISDVSMHDIYGVVSDEQRGVEAQATETLRASLRANRLTVVTSHEDDSYRKTEVSRHRRCRLSPSDADRIKANEGDLVELDSKVAAPLRAWLDIDPNIPDGTAPLDGIGHNMLLIGTGDSLVIRRLGLGKPPPLNRDPEKS